MPRNGVDPDGDGHTEETIQAYPILYDGMRAPEDYTTDAEEMRTRFNNQPGVSMQAFDPEAFRPEKGKAVSGVYPDMVIHVDSPSDGHDLVNSPKASTTLVEAAQGSGKSTFADYLAIRQMEENNERIIRNGRQKTSEWRRVADWVTVWLPSGTDIETRWMEAVDEDAPDLEEIARAVRYYDDVFELVERLQDPKETPKGTFSVVYPDPFFRGCEEAVRLADSSVKQPRFVPKTEEDPTPATHWWFGFIAARTFEGVRVDVDGERNWMTLHIDEFGMFAPQSASGGEEGHWTWQCIQIMADIDKEMRKAGISVVGYTHDAEDVHDQWLKEFNYWIELANGERSNRRLKSETPKPFRDLPQDQDLISSRPRGFGLCYNGSKFSEFRFDDLGYPHGLPEFQVRLGIPESVTISGSEGRMRADDLVVARDDEGQPTLLEEYSAAAGSVRELRVRSPGAGVIDISGDEPEVIEALESPYEGGSFPTTPITERPDAYEVVFVRSDEKEIVAARIPRETGVAGGNSSGVMADD